MRRGGRRGRRQRLPARSRVRAGRALRARALESVALEDPGPRGHDVIARRAGLDVVPVPVDDEGLDVGRLRETTARAVLVTPAHQCPTGVACSARPGANELVTWANEVDGVILEDDYDAEFRYDRQAGRLPAGAGRRSGCIALGSVSKTMAPAITHRLGARAATLPGEVLTEEKQLSSRGAPGLDQEALALLVESGAFDRHLRRVRDLYRSPPRRPGRRRSPPSSVADRLRRTGCRLPHACSCSRDDVDEDAVVEAARSSGSTSPACVGTDSRRRRPSQALRPRLRQPLRAPARPRRPRPRRGGPALPAPGR